MILIIISFLAGILSVLAPCVLPVIPVIFSGSLAGNKGSQTRRIIVSMMISIVLFTFLLKVSTLFISIDPHFWTTVSSAIIMLYGLVLIFPQVWEKLSMWLRLDRVNTLSDQASHKQWVWGDILLGASLWPIFSTCSPTYALLFSTVLPINLTLGLICMIAYALGFGGFLWILVKGGKSLIKKFYGVSDSHSLLKKVLGIILLITWLLIFTGHIKKLETAFLDYVPDVSKIEQVLIKQTKVADEFSSMNNANNAALNTSWWDGSEGAKLLNANYPAPDIGWLTGWLNSSAYTSLSQLSWKVVIIDFRTYSCINCIRTLPYLEKRYETYAKDGLVILGVHAPEFAFERVFENVRKASAEFGLSYPIAMDNDYTVWSNYNNHYRPAKYIIDREGKVRYTHFGEGNYEETEKVIQHLLWLTVQPSGTLEQMQTELDSFQGLDLPVTPETYLGTTRRWDNLIWSLEGQWNQEQERITLQSSTWAISIGFQAREVNLVLDSKDNTPVKVTVMEGDAVLNTFTITDSKLYNIVTYTEAWAHMIRIIIESPEVSAYAFTFG